MDEPEVPPPSPNPARPRLVAPLAVSATASAASLFAATALTRWADGYEPCAGAAAGAAAILLAIVILTRGRRKSPVPDGRDGAHLPTAAGFGAALGALAFAAALPLLSGAIGGRPVVRHLAGNSVSARLHGRQQTYPEAARAHADALVACGQAPSLARVLMIGGGRPGLVRELLGRGAVGIDVVDPDPGLAEALAPYLSDEDRAAGALRQIQHHTEDALEFLRLHDGPPYDLVIVSPPEPRSIRSGRWYSLELHRSIASRIAPLGVVVVSLPESLGKDPGGPLARIFVAMQEAYPRNAVLAIPGSGLRLLAARNPRVLTLAPAVAAKRCSERPLPRGGSAPHVSATEMQQLLAADRARELTEALGDSATPETLRAPRLFLEERALTSEGPGLGRAVLSTPLWTFLPVLMAGLAGGMLLARRTSTREAPGRFALGTMAFLAGTAAAGALLTVMLVYQTLRGALATQLPFLAAAAAAGAGLGGAAAARLAAAVGKSPRKGLTATGFAGLVVLLLTLAATNLTPPGPAAGTLVALALAAIGFAAGLELGALSAACPASDRGVAPRALVAGLGLLGAATGAALVAIGLLPALGPGVALLMMIGVELVALGVLAAGAGGR